MQGTMLHALEELLEILEELCEEDAKISDILEFCELKEEKPELGKGKEESGMKELNAEEGLLLPGEELNEEGLLESLEELCEEDTKGSDILEFCEPKELLCPCPPEELDFDPPVSPPAAPAFTPHSIIWQIPLTHVGVGHTP